MIRFISFILIFCLSSFVHSQSRFLIYFKDKGVNSVKKVQSLSPSDIGLSKKSVDRRLKVMNQVFTEVDLPINQEYIQFLELSNISIIHKLNWFNAVSAYLTEEDIEYLSSQFFISEISRVKRFIRKEPEYSQYSTTELLKASSRFDYKYDYGASLTQYELSDIPLLHSKLGISGEGVVVGLLDTGFGWKNHPALKDRNVLAEWDFVNNDSCTANSPDENPNQDNHGTLTFSILGGFDEGNLVAPAFSSQFLLAKTEDIDSESIVEEDNYAAAMEWMDKMGADIVTASLGYSEFDNPEDSYTYEDMNGKTAICTRANELAFERGILCISSAGNSGNKEWRYITAPADGYNTISIGAVDKFNNVTDFSSVGPTYDGRIKPEVCAMGQQVYGARSVTGSYYYASGTSVSAPIVAGIAALLKSYYPHLTNIQLRRILLEAGDNVKDPNNSRGFGLVSAKCALEFPNIEKINDDYKLHSLFINDSRFLDKAVFSSNGVNEESNFGNANEYYYETTIPQYSFGNRVQLYLASTKVDGDNSDIEILPEEGRYQFEYGKIDLRHNTIENLPAINVENFKIRNNYPNPFYSSTTLIFDSHVETSGKLLIFNTLGQKISELHNGVINKGRNSFHWNGLSDNGEKCASGIYIYAFWVEDEMLSNKMILLR